MNVSSTDWIAVGAIALSLLAFFVTIHVVKQSTKSQIKVNRELINSHKDSFEKELAFKNKQVITQNFIQYASKFISGQANLILKLRDFKVFYGSISNKEKLDRTTHVGQIYQELRDISNQVLQDYHVLELFLLTKGRSIVNLEMKNILFFQFLWRYLEILLDQPESESWLKKENQTIIELLEYSEFQKLGNDLKKIIGEDNITIYLLLNELNRQISKLIQAEIKKAA
ncbi:hypothetical protein A3K93_08125 [Acinetobacter sp. NCu2D-2]|uniref:hypothetical protein n=1 Tax=Acinetobacter sp. NCu2D-2 TaxID=1608473 RepID=UPI0007CDAC2F|nr:hypothetical protein [Acinetobacter sp. NCu2D-2]ANF82162.1 hypothetical protein A3K93_08125 [Acinetobacter sp. NCu2D-2]